MDASGNHGEKEAAEVRRARAFELRSMGWTYERIGEFLTKAGIPCSNATAHRDCALVMKRLQRQTVKEAESYVGLENHRLDVALHTLMKILTGKSAPRVQIGAVREIVHISERRSKLFGLDKPTKSEISGPDGGAIPLGFEDSLKRAYGSSDDTGS